MTTVFHATDTIVADAYFPALTDHIVTSTGLVFYADRPDALARHVADRLRKRGLKNCEDYLDLLRDAACGEVELDAIVELLSIGETFFFRHRELFDALRDVALPEIIERNRATRRLRVWSAGCSTGPEAYSVSILLRRDLAACVDAWNISILGTDINRPFMSQATQGLYEEWAFRGTPPEFRRDCFEPEGKAWRIAKRFQNGVAFQYHNLARHPFPSLVHNLAAFDLILCRNVLIYFAPDVVERIVSQLAECLVPGGWLAIGHAEHGAKCLESLEAISAPGATLYRKPRNGSSRSFCNSELLRDAGLSPQFAGDRNLPFRYRDPIESLAGQRVVNSVAGPIERSGGSVGSREIDRVRALADEGDVEDALQLCDSLIAESPLEASLHFYRGLLLDQVAGHAAALEALNRALYLDREFVLAHYYLGTTFLKVSNSVSAARSFRNVRRLIAGHDLDERLPNAEGMTIADLDELTRLHMATLDAV